MKASFCKKCNMATLLWIVMGLLTLNSCGDWKYYGRMPTQWQAVAEDATIVVTYYNQSKVTYQNTFYSDTITFHNTDYFLCHIGTIVEETEHIDAKYKMVSIQRIAGNSPVYFSQLPTITINGQVDSTATTMSPHQQPMGFPHIAWEDRETDARFLSTETQTGRALQIADAVQQQFPENILYIDDNEKHTVEVIRQINDPKVNIILPVSNP